MIDFLADALALLAALAAWRWSRLVALALALGSAVSLVYFLTPWEPLRWISLVTGCLGSEAAIAAAFATWAPREARARIASLGSLLVASTLVDLLALYRHRTGHPWGVQPVLQVAACLAMLAVSLWPRRSAPSP